MRKSKKYNRIKCLVIDRAPGLAVLSLAGAAMFLPDAAWAAVPGGGETLQWEAPLKTVAASLAGPVAQSVSLLALVVGGIGLAFGGEMAEWTRTVLRLTMVIALIVFATPLLNTLFAVGAVVGGGL